MYVKWKYNSKKYTYTTTSVIFSPIVFFIYFFANKFNMSHKIKTLIQHDYQFYLGFTMRFNNLTTQKYFLIFIHPNN